MREGKSVFTIATLNTIYTAFNTRATKGSSINDIIQNGEGVTKMRIWVDRQGCNYLG